MTELERTLKNTLLTLEQELSATQKTYGTSLANHQRSLEIAGPQKRDSMVRWNHDSKE